MSASAPKKRNDRAAYFLVLPFVAVYAVLFVYPTAQMLWSSLTSQGLIVAGDFTGVQNYARLLSDPRLMKAIVNTTQFVLMTVVPGTLIGLMLALMVNRLKGVVQGVVLAVLFLPYMLPVTTVVLIWNWVIYGPFQLVWFAVMHRPLNLAVQSWMLLPIVAVLTIWWTAGFNVLILLGGLRSIPPDLYEAARIDGAGRRAQFSAITWPLMRPFLLLVLTIQLIWQIKVFDQVYLMAQGTRSDVSIVLVQYIYLLAFQNDKGGYAASVAVALFVVVVAISLMQAQLLARGRKS
jgi:multiple sugar transport system permease protein